MSSCNFDHTNEPRGRLEPKVHNDELKVTVEYDPSKSAYELLLKFCVSKQTILIHLAQIYKVKKVGLSLVMRNGFNITITKVQHSAWTRMNQQNILQSAIFTKRW